MDCELFTTDVTSDTVAATSLTLELPCIACRHGGQDNSSVLTAISATTTKTETAIAAPAPFDSPVSVTLMTNCSLFADSTVFYPVPYSHGSGREAPDCAYRRLAEQDPRISGALGW